jgi:hypothetical protein
VCVIASVYRHNPRDYDEQGRRIPCPRFGGVTCGEHIWIEPLLFDKYFEGKRIAPRHIMVELDQAGGLRRLLRLGHADDLPRARRRDRQPAAAAAAGEPRPPLEQRITSRDAEDRSAVEQAYLAARPRSAGCCCST